MWLGLRSLSGSLGLATYRPTGQEKEMNAEPYTYEELEALGALDPGKPTTEEVKEHAARLREQAVEDEKAGRLIAAHQKRREAQQVLQEIR